MRRRIWNQSFPVYLQACFTIFCGVFSGKYSSHSNLPEETKNDDFKAVIWKKSPASLAALSSLPPLHFARSLILKFVSCRVPRERGQAYSQNSGHLALIDWLLFTENCYFFLSHSWSSPQNRYIHVSARVCHRNPRKTKGISPVKGLIPPRQHS